MKKEKSRQQRWHERNPWARFVAYAHRRCNDSNPRSKNYAHYFAKGIKCTLTAAQTKILWLRDKADKLTNPSLDREKPHLGYTFENCRFIELDLNRRLPWISKNPPPVS